MVRAAASGAIDFSRADPWDKWWWRKTYWILGELARQNNALMHTARHRYWCAMLTRSNLQPSAMEHVHQSCEETLNKIQRTLYPWQAAETGERQSTANALETMWRDTFGDPNDPAVQAEIEKGLAVMRAMSEQAFTEEDDA